MFYDKFSLNFYSTTGGWWPCEDVALRSMINDHYSYVRMAHVLDRSYAGVISRITTLGLLDQYRKSLCAHV